MSNLANVNDISAIEKCLIHGDLSSLTDLQRVNYANQVCNSVGLNPLTKPFEYIKLNGKLVLYAGKNCAEQLRKVQSISLTITSREKFDDLYVVTAKATRPDGRTDESTGAVVLAGLKGEALANALMKCETKAKRRVTLSICSLGMLDETEIESIRHLDPTAIAEAPKAHDEIESKKPTEFKTIVGRTPEAKSPGEYVATFGKYKNKKLVEIDIHELQSYVDFIQRKALEDGKPIQGTVLEFMEAAGNLLDSRQAIDKNENIPF